MMVVHCDVCDVHVAAGLVYIVIILCQETVEPTLDTSDDTTSLIIALLCFLSVLLVLTASDSD